MTDNTLNLDALTEAFKADCKVIRLKYEYPGYTGTEKYAIISDLSYEQISIPDGAERHRIQADGNKQAQVLH